MNDNPAADPATALGRIYHQDSAHSNALDKLFRREHAVVRNWYKAIHELGRLQEGRSCPAS
jgi:hypothetical protein